MIRFDNDMPNDYSEVLENLVIELPKALQDRSSAIIKALAKLTRPNAIALHELAHSEMGRLWGRKNTDFIKIEVKYKHTPEEILAAKSESTPESLLSGIAACSVASDIEDVLCLAQLAYPCRIHTLPTCVYIKNIGYNSVQGLGGLPYDYLLPSESNWPRIQPMSLGEILSWEKEIGLFDNGIAKTPIQRALASFTNAVGRAHSTPEELLFWVMQGLESFYCRGTGDLRKQLADKTKIFLGPWSDQKNIVGKMYDMRSKFVHGSFNLVRWNNSYDIAEHDHNNQMELHETSKLATNILIASLHRCVAEGIYSTEFDYVLRAEKFNP